MIEWLDQADRLSPWSDIHVVVDTLTQVGFSAADVMVELGARVTVLDQGNVDGDKAKLLEVLGAEVRRGTQDLPEDADLVIASDHSCFDSPILTTAEARGVPVWSDVEMAFRLQRPDRIVPWLGVTGTAGVGTTVAMIESMLATAGLAATAVGYGNRPVLETVLDEISYDVLVVGMSAPMIRWSPSVRFHSAAVLTLEPQDTNEELYARIYYQVTHSCLYNVGEPRTEAMVEEADVVEGARAIGFTTGIPAISMVGVVDDRLVDRAFIPQRRDSALELASIADLPDGPAGLVDALAAAGLARSFGIPATAVRDGLRGFEPGRAINPLSHQGES